MFTKRHSISFSMRKLVIVFAVSTVALTAKLQPRSSVNNSHSLQHARATETGIAQLGQYPYQIDLSMVSSSSEFHFCEGTLISPSSVLGSGRCLTYTNTPVSSRLLCRAGLVNKYAPTDSEQAVFIHKTVLNPNYSGGISPNDIALYILESPLQINNYVSPVHLPTSKTVPTGIATLTGWGGLIRPLRTDEADVLQAVDLPILSSEGCQAAIKKVDNSLPFTESMICTGPVTGISGSCKNFSGSPLVIGPPGQKILVGIDSWFLGPCYGVNTYIVYTNVGYFTNFINENGG